MTGLLILLALAVAAEWQTWLAAYVILMALSDLVVLAGAGALAVGRLVR